MYKKSHSCLIALAEILDDNTLYKAKLSLFTDSNYPLKYHPAIKQHFSFSREREKKYKGKTLGQIACDALKKATAQDFGTDKEEWKAWVKKHF